MLREAFVLLVSRGLVGAVVGFCVGFLLRCGLEPNTEIKPPNVADACAHAIECGVFAEEDAAQCTVCLEHVDEEALNDLLEEAEAIYGELPPIEQIECGLIELAVRVTNIGECVEERWSWKESPWNL